MQTDFYANWEQGRVEEAFATSADTGLTEAEAVSRIKKQSGSSVLPDYKVSLLAFLRLAMRQLSPLFLAVAILFAALCGYRAMAIVSGAFYAVFLLVLFLLYAYRETAMMQNAADSLPAVPVLRDGKRCTVSADALVPGDILLLEAGAVVFAEARILQGDNLAVWTTIGKRRYTVAKGAEKAENAGKLPPNMLKPGDIVRQGEGRAVVVGLPSEKAKKKDFTAELSPDACAVCRFVGRAGFALVYAALLFRFFFGAPVLFPLFFLCGAVLIAVSPTEWITLLLQTVFLIKNNLLLRKKKGCFVSPAAAQSMAEADCFLLPGDAVFRSDFYRVRSFITADGHLLSPASGRTTNELGLISSCLLAVREKQPSEKEKYIHSFCKQHERELSAQLSSLGASADGTCSFAFFRTGDGPGRGFTLIGGEPECLLPHLMYASEEGRAHLIDLSTRRALLNRVKKMRQNGYRVVAYAESQMLRGAGDLSAAQDMKLLGFFVLFSVPDRDAEKNMADWEREGKKAVFLHNGDDPAQLLSSLPESFSVMALDGTAPDFEERFTAFALDRDKNFSVLYHMDAQKKAQAVRILSSAGHTVAAYGEGFEDHRMVCAAHVAVSLPSAAKKEGNGAVYEAAALHTPSKPGAIAAAARVGNSITASFDAVSAFLCTAFILRTVACVVGIFGGKTVLSPLFLLLLAVAVDFPAVICAAYATYAGDNRENPVQTLTSFLGGVFFAALYSGIFSVYLLSHRGMFSFDSNGFLLVAFLLLSNVVFLSYGRVRFSFPAVLFALYCFLLPALFLYLGFRSVSAGVPYSSVLLFWAIVPTVIFIVAKGAVTAFLRRRVPEEEEMLRKESYSD